jgi:hypothetical protein
MNLSLTFFHFNEIYKNGYTLDMLFLLKLIEENIDVKALCNDDTINSHIKLSALYQSIYRKGLITEKNTITLSGKKILEFLNSEESNVKLIKTKVSVDDFELWWKKYPGTDTFKYKGVSFTGTRGLRKDKEQCNLKFNKILNEGDYTATDLISALEYEVLQKKENSIKNKSNRMTFMQNSLTYLNQKTFEPFIELIKEGYKIKEIHQVEGGTDI